MTISRRRFLSLASAITGTSAFAAPASADVYPSRPVRILVGYPPGGPTDIIARLIARRLEDRLGGKFVVENHPGADGNIAAEACTRAAADGYTLLMISGANAYNVALYDSPNFDFIRDVTPVASIGRVWAVLEVHPSVPARTVPEFIIYAKELPGKITMASTGIGSGPHLYSELFKQMVGVDFQTVQYTGSAAALPDLIAGRVQAMFDLVVSSIDYIRAGKLLPLGVTSPGRLSILPELSPIADYVPGYKTEGWYGIGAPAGTPGGVVNKLNSAIDEALNDPQFAARLAELGAEAFPNSADEFHKFVIEFTNKWDKIIRASGIKLD